MTSETSINYYSGGSNANTLSFLERTAKKYMRDYASIDAIATSPLPTTSERGSSQYSLVFVFGDTKALEATFGILDFFGDFFVI